MLVHVGFVVNRMEFLNVLAYAVPEGLEARLDSNGNCSVVDPKTGAAATVGNAGVQAAISVVKKNQTPSPHGPVM